MTNLEPSYCDNIPRPKGIGYNPPPGSISHLYTGNNGSGTHEAYLMDLSAHGFGDTHTYSMELQRRRYGPNFHGTDINKPRFLAIDFESIFGLGSIYLSKLACENKFGTAKTLSCYPTLEELHDYYAVNPTEGFKAMGLSGSVSNNPPGIPILISYTSPSPGLIKVVLEAARTKGHTSYQLGVWPESTMINIDIPPYIGQVRTDGIITPGKERKEIEVNGLERGFYRVKVRSLVGVTVGRWSSMTGLVEVKQAAGQVPTLPPIPTLPPTQPQTPIEPQNPPTNPIPSTPTNPPNTPPITPTLDPRDLKIQELKNKLGAFVEGYNQLANKIEDAMQEMENLVSKLNKD